jgi:hypothetical protein
MGIFSKIKTNYVLKRVDTRKLIEEIHSDFKNELINDKWN